MRSNSVFPGQRHRPIQSSLWPAGRKEKPTQLGSARSRNLMSTQSRPKPPDATERIPRTAVRKPAAPRRRLDARRSPSNTGYFPQSNPNIHQVLIRNWLRSLRMHICPTGANRRQPIPTAVPPPPNKENIMTLAFARSKPYRPHPPSPPYSPPCAASAARSRSSQSPAAGARNRYCQNAAANRPARCPLHRGERQRRSLRLRATRFRCKHAYRPVFVATAGSSATILRTARLT